MNYFDIAKAFAPLPRKVQTSLCIAAQAGDTDASDTLVKTNMRLAINVARKHKRNGIELDDLVPLPERPLTRSASLIRTVALISRWLPASGWLPAVKKL